MFTNLLTGYLFVYIFFYPGHSNVVKYLLENGADINKRNNRGDTAMHFAARHDHFEIVKILLANNAQQLKNNHGIFFFMLNQS